MTLAADLCIGCAFCISRCPQGCIRIQDDQWRGCYQARIDMDRCLCCGECARICPGLDADLITGIPDTWPKTCNHHPRLGYYAAMGIGHTLDKEVHSKSASGGIATELLAHLLTQKMIDGAIVVVMSSIDPLKAESVIAKSVADLEPAQQSKYCPIPMGNILNSLSSESGRFAFVGLPCHVQTLRKIQAGDPDLKTKIPYIIGLFCSRLPSFNATRYLLARRNIDLFEVRTLEYRSGPEHIGHMHIGLKDGRRVRVPHLHFDYWGFMYQNFFILPRCYLCPDKAAALADIALGDNWSSKMFHPKGTSTIIARSPKMLAILDEMIATRKIAFGAVDPDTVIQSQDLKRKQNIEPRRYWWTLLGGKLPRYHLTLPFKTSWIDRIKSFPAFVRFMYSRKYSVVNSLTVLAKCFFAAEKIEYILARMVRMTTNTLRMTVSLLLSWFPAKTRNIEKQAKYKIVMIGGYGWRDIGDEAMPHADLLNFKQRLGRDLEIVMLSENPEYTQAYHQEKTVPDIDKISPLPQKDFNTKIYNLFICAHMAVFLIGVFLFKKGFYLRLWPTAFNALRHLASADLVFNVGGGNLNSLIPEELYKKGITYIAASMLGKPIIVSGQTMGPYVGRKDRWFARWVLDKPMMITFRDKDISLRRCTELNLSRPILKTAADDAMTLPYISSPDALNLLKKDPGVSKEWLNSHTDLVVSMNLKGSLSIFTVQGQTIDLSKITTLIARLADMIVADYGAKILFVPTDFCDAVDDRPLHRQIVMQMQRPRAVASLENEYVDTELKGIINRCDVAIGARYHFCVFAASVCVPFLGAASGAYQTTKLRGLALLCNLPECFYEEDLRIADFQTLAARTHDVIVRRREISKQLKARVPELKQQSLTAVNTAVEWLQSRTD